MVSEEVIVKCKEKLCSIKEDLMNLRNSTIADFSMVEPGGDETDQSVRCINEARSVEINERIRQQLFEVEMALLRIQTGTFGFCEETGEAIEKDRLLAIPWTRLSIEGAEMREAISKVRKGARSS